MYAHGKPSVRCTCLVSQLTDASLLTQQKRVFGTPLSDEQPIPRVLRDCVDYLVNEGQGNAPLVACVLGHSWHPRAEGRGSVQEIGELQ